MSDPRFFKNSGPFTLEEIYKFIGKELNWAHIDVMAWNLNSRPGRPKGGEAMGLRTVYQYIAELAKNY